MLFQADGVGVCYVFLVVICIIERDWNTFGGIVIGSSLPGVGKGSCWADGPWSSLVCVYMKYRDDYPVLE